MWWFFSEMCDLEEMLYSLEDFWLVVMQVDNGSNKNLNLLSSAFCFSLIAQPAGQRLCCLLRNSHIFSFSQLSNQVIQRSGPFSSDKKKTKKINKEWNCSFTYSITIKNTNFLWETLKYSYIYFYFFSDLNRKKTQKTDILILKEIHKHPGQSH